jgi:hypothetical protein
MVAAMVLGALRRSEVLGLRFDDLRVAERRMISASILRSSRISRREPPSYAYSTPLA